MPRARAGNYPQPLNTIWAEREGFEYDISGGWHHKREEGWWNKAKRHRVNLYDLHGEKHRMTTYETDDVIVGFESHQGDHAERQMLLADAEEAFKDPDNVESSTGCGHIKLVEFATAYRILRVTFYDNTVVVYRDVPTYIAGTLLHWAKTKQLAVSGNTSYGVGRNKRDRHQLGVSFWDLIRIRGHQTGSKFPFEYVSHGTYTVASGKGRHLVKGQNGNTYMVNFSEEEWNMYVDCMKTLSALKALNRKNVIGNSSSQTEAKGVEDEANSIEEIADEIGLTDAEQSKLSDLRKAIDAKEASVNNYLLKQLFNRVEAEIQRLAKGGLAEDYGDIAEDRVARKQFVEDNIDMYPVLGLMNLKSKDIKMRQINDMDSLKKARRKLEEFDEDGVLSWMRKGDKTQSVSHKVWTPQMLADFANPYIEGNITQADAAKYRVYVDNKDWEGALRFLKHAKQKRIIKDSKSGAVYPEEYKSYADKHDILGSDEY